MTAPIHSPFRYAEDPRGSIMLDDYNTHTPLYRKWRAHITAGGRYMPWPDYRDTHTAPTPNKRGRPRGGLGHNNGTIRGLSKRAEKLLAPAKNGIVITPMATHDWLFGKGGVHSLPEIKAGRSK